MAPIHCRGSDTERPTPSAVQLARTGGQRKEPCCIQRLLCMRGVDDDQKGD